MSETSDETSETEVSTESPPENLGEEIVTELSEDPSPLDREEFERRVSKLCQMMEEDPTVRDRIIAETYVNMASAEMGIRGMFELVQKQGLSGMMRGAFKRS